MQRKFPKLRKYAKGQDCTFQLPGCSPGPDNETVVLCHAPSEDNGMGLKAAPDYWGAYGCHSCHNIMDGRDNSVTLMPKEKLEAWMRAIYRTQRRVFEDGIIRVQ